MHPHEKQSRNLADLNTTNEAPIIHAAASYRNRSHFDDDEPMNDLGGRFQSELSSNLSLAYGSFESSGSIFPEMLIQLLRVKKIK